MKEQEKTPECKPETLSICIQGVEILLSMFIVWYTHKKIKVVRDPKMNQNYNMLTLRIFKTLRILSLFSIPKLIYYIIILSLCINVYNDETNTLRIENEVQSRIYLIVAKLF